MIAVDTTGFDRGFPLKPSRGISPYLPPRASEYHLHSRERRVEEAPECHGADLERHIHEDTLPDILAAGVTAFATPGMTQGVVGRSAELFKGGGEFVV